MTNETMVELVGINKSFDSCQVLYDIFLGVKKGEFITLLGPSGCGKTTLLRIIGGFEQVDSVSAEISKAFPYGNPNQAAEKYIPPDLLTNPAVSPPAEVIKKGDHLENVGEAMNQYMQIWTEFKASK